MAKTLLHRGLHYRRVETDKLVRGVTLESVFADLWEEENERRPGRNYGYGLLQDLMFGHWDRSKRCRVGRDFFLDQPWVRFLIRRRDAVIAATVVQWLGSNVGFSFLEQALNRAGYVIRRADDKRRSA